MVSGVVVAGIVLIMVALAIGMLSAEENMLSTSRQVRAFQKTSYILSKMCSAGECVVNLAGILLGVLMYISI